jgi:hypothetical protein
MDGQQKGFRPRPDSVPKYFPRGLRTPEVQPTTLQKTTVQKGHATGVVASARQDGHVAPNGNTYAERMQRRLEVWNNKHSNADKVRQRAMAPRKLSNTNRYYMP